VNGWTPEEINDLEARAATRKTIWLMSTFLWEKTGWNFLKCVVIARYVRAKYDQTDDKD
jgi:hypothetical protein